MSTQGVRRLNSRGTEMATTTPRETLLQQCPLCRRWGRVPLAEGKLRCECGHVMRIYAGKRAKPTVICLEESNAQT
jgi:hypothetical protein